METLETLVSLWWIYAIASAVLVWYAVSSADDRVERSCAEWEAMMVGRRSDSDPVPDVPEHRMWDIYAYYWTGAVLGMLAIICGALKFLEFIFVTLLPAL